MSEQSPYERVEEDQANYERLAAKQQAATNIVSRLFYKSRAMYVGVLIEQDLEDIEALEVTL